MLLLIVPLPRIHKMMQKSQMKPASVLSCIIEEKRAFGGVHCSYSHQHIGLPFASAGDIISSLVVSELQTQL